MSGKIVVGVVMVASVAIGGWALAEQERPAAKAPAQAESGSFVVSPTAKSAILLDTKTGKTWELNHSVTRDHVWLPGKRIDSEQEANDWRKQEEEKGRVNEEKIHALEEMIRKSTEEVRRLEEDANRQKEELTRRVKEEIRRRGGQ
jgi:hypothetical protein